MALEKRYNFRIYPTVEQERQIQKTFGCCRFVYNYYLNKRIEHYESNHSIYSFYECCLDMTQIKGQEEYAWLKEVDLNALQSSLKDLDEAYKGFFRRMKQGGAPGFPIYKSKHENRRAYRSKNNKNSNNLAIVGDKIKLTKLGYVDCRVSRQIEGRILSATITQARSGKYYVSVCCTDVEPQKLPKTGRSVGLHLGLKEFVVSSDGECYENHKYLDKSLRKIKRLQRLLSRKSKGSKRQEKARIKLAKAHEKVANQRKDTLNKLTTNLVREYDAIYVKEVPVQEMTRDKRFAQPMGDASWGTFVRQLEYKCRWYGKDLRLVNKAFPSAQLCSSCGYRNVEVKKLHKRVWVCPVCGTHHIRGVNAAVNVLKEGQKQAA